MLYGLLSFTTVTSLSDTEWSLSAKLYMPSGVSTSSLDTGTTVFIKGMNDNGYAEIHKFKVTDSKYSRGKLTLTVSYDDGDTIYAPSLEEPWGVITSKDTEDGFYFLPTTDMGTTGLVSQSALDYIRNLDLQERATKYDAKMKVKNDAQDESVSANASNIAEHTIDINNLKTADQNIMQLISMIADGGTFDEDESE